MAVMQSNHRFPLRQFAAALLTASLPCAARAQLPVGVFGYDRARPLDVQATPYRDLPAVRFSRLSYDSPGGRVTGLLAEPTSPGRHPGVVLLHGLPGTAEGAMTRFGEEIAQHGAVVIAIDAPWVRRGGMPDLTLRDSVEQVQLMVDLQRAVDVLLSRGDVDAARLAYVGGSYGGAMGSLFAGIERRLKAYVLFVPDGGLVAHFTNADGSPSGPLARLGADARERWLAAMRPIEPIRFIPRAAPAALLFQNGRSDQLVTVEDAEALHAAAPQPKTIRWYDAGHGLNAEARADRLAWLAEQIGITP